MVSAKMNLIEACGKAAEIVVQAQDMEALYRRGVRCMGEGELRHGILNMAIDAVEDQALREEVFVDDDSLLSFLCGVWIQFLLTEIAGVKKDKLRTMAQKIFTNIQENRSFH